MDAFKASGTSPTAEPDFRVENHGTIFLLQPLTSAANDWIETNLPEDRMTFAGAVVPTVTLPGGNGGKTIL